MTVNETNATILDAVSLVEVESALVEINDDDLDSVAGGAHQASGSHFHQSQTEMKGFSHAGPDGADSGFSVKTKETESSSWEAQDDLS